MQTIGNEERNVKQINRQNTFVAASMDMVERTIELLFNLDLTVLDVRLGDRTPLIHIQQGPGCERLAGHTYYRHRSPHRVVKRASLNRCIVEWTESRVPSSNTQP